MLILLGYMGELLIAAQYAIILYVALKTRYFNGITRALALVFITEFLYHLTSSVFIDPEMPMLTLLAGFAVSILTFSVNVNLYIQLRREAFKSLEAFKNKEKTDVSTN